MKRIITSIALVAVATAAAVGFFDRLIDSRVFYPDRVLMAAPENLGLAYEEVWFEAEDGVRLHGWFLPARPGRDLLLFCHGNAGNISHRLHNLALLNSLGLAVFIFDYRGYGWSHGRINEEGFYLDALGALAAAQALAGRNKARLILFGRSLGGVAATYLAAEKGGAVGLILESTFTNLADMARFLFRLPWTEMYLSGRFDSLSRIGRVRCPVLVFHGDRDELVPPHLGRRLFLAAPEPKEFVPIAGAGHNDTYLVGGQAYLDKWREFLNRLP